MSSLGRVSPQSAAHPPPPRAATRPAGAPSAWRGRLEAAADWAATRRRALLATLTVATLALAAVALTRTAGGADYAAIQSAFAATSWPRIAVALVLTALSFLTLTFYDYNAFAAIGRPQRWARVAPGAACAYAVAQTAGFGPLSGAAVRLRFYAALGVGPGAIVRVVAFATLSFGYGIVAVGAAATLASPDTVAEATGLSRQACALAGLLGCAATAAALLLARRTIPLPGGRSARAPSRDMMIRQIVTTAADVAAAAGALWILLPEGAVDFAGFLPIYAAALALGYASHVPAGLGVFEAVVLAALAGAAPASDVLAALALYRIVYHAAPLLLASAAIVAAEGRRASASPEARRIAGALAPPVPAGLSLLLGAMLVFSAVTPALDPDLVRLGRVLPLPVIEGAHLLASVLGAVLMIAARGLAYRLDRAWRMALIAACAAPLLSVLKAAAVYEAAALALLALGLATARRAFRRPAPRASTLTPRWTAAMAAVLLAALAIDLFIYDQARLDPAAWLEFGLSAEAPRSLRALAGAGLAVALAACWSFLRVGRAEPGRPTPADLDRARAIAAAQPAAMGCFVGMGDKRVMFSDDGRAFLMYGRQGRSWIALGDPVGPTDAWPELVWRFLEGARLSGRRAAFYEIGPDHLPLYADAGLALHKLGEEARIDLAAFTLSGRSRAGHRNVLSRGARDGLSLELLPPGGAGDAMQELARVSDAWLATRGMAEKGFSLGAFDPAWLSRHRIAVLRHDGRVAAFATLVASGLGEEAQVDLMRRLDDIHPMAMEYLFLRLAEELKAEGFRWLGLGMAPLSGLSPSEAAPVWHRVGRLVFEHGERLYNFRGLRAFKQKFRPHWRSRYLATARGSSAPLILMDAARLIGKGAGPNRARPG